jgi:hypothetical protein
MARKLMRAIALVGAGMGGYARGQQIYRQNQAAEEDAEWRREQRENLRKDRTELEAEKQELAAAAKPVVVEAAGGRPDTMDDRDVGQPGEAPVAPRTFKVGMKSLTSQGDAESAAAAANTPAAVTGRMADVVARRDPARAQQLRMAATQGEAAQLQLTKARDLDVREKALRDLGGRLIQGGWSAVPSIYDSYNDGHKVTVAEDGKGGATVTTLGPDGKPVGQPRQFKDLAHFYSAIAGSKFDPKLWMDDETRRATAAQTQANNDREFGLREKSEARRATHEARMLSAAERAARAAEGKASAPAPVWDDKADEFLKKRYTLTDEVSGATRVDGHGLQFAKQIAVAQARRNGGDVTSALGYAFDVDEKIKEQAGGDQKKVRQMRADLLARLYEAPAADAAPAAPAAAPAHPNPTAAPAPAAAPAPRPGPMQQVANPMAEMSDATLKQLAAIDGHVNQKAAAAELQRRAAAAQPVDTSGIGFGRAGS